MWNGGIDGGGEIVAGVQEERDKGGHCAGREDQSIPMRVWRVVYYFWISQQKAQI